MWGYDTMEEMEAVPLEDRYPPEDYLAFQEKERRRKSGLNVNEDFETNITRKNGEIRRVSVIRRDITWNGIPQSQIIYQDVTARTQAEETG
jgi:PAS domain S-box-containing protein